MRYNEITTTEAGPVAGFDHSFKAAKGRTDKTILRALVKDFGGPLNKSMSEYNQGIKELRQGGVTLPANHRPFNTTNIGLSHMFMGMARSMFRVGRGKKDMGQLLTFDEPSEVLRLITMYSEKNWRQRLHTALRDKDAKKLVQSDFANWQNLKKKLAGAPGSLFGNDIEDRINSEVDMIKFYAFVDFFEVVLTTMNMKDAAGKLSPSNIAKGFQDFERDVRGDRAGAGGNLGWVQR